MLSDVNPHYLTYHICGEIKLCVYTNRKIVDTKKVKVKASHTRYRALGPELIPVYRQSARR